MRGNYDFSPRATAFAYVSMPHRLISVFFSFLFFLFLLCQALASSIFCTAMRIFAAPPPPSATTYVLDSVRVPACDFLNKLSARAPNLGRPLSSPNHQQHCPTIGFGPICASSRACSPAPSFQCRPRKVPISASTSTMSVTHVRNLFVSAREPQCHLLSALGKTMLHRDSMSFAALRQFNRAAKNRIWRVLDTLVHERLPAA